MNTKIDIRLERDPRYAAAKAKLFELQSEVTALDRQRNDADAGLASTIVTHSDRIASEASALLSGGPVFVPAREALIRTLTELTHRLAVVSQAVVMQRQIVDELRGEVGKAIAIDLLPQHKANVAAVFKALIQLNAVAQVHFDLCDSLNQNNVPSSGYIRPMPIPGLGLLSDQYSRASTFVLEAYEYDFITFSEVPDNLKEWAKAKKSKPVRVAQAPAVANADGWLNATA